MQKFQRSCRSLRSALFFALLTAVLPSRLARAEDVRLPNLNLEQGLTHWQQTAMGSNTYPHPYFEIGMDPAVKEDGRPSGFVRSTRKDPDEKYGDGGVLRYDIPTKNAAAFVGKRLRLSAFVKGANLNRQAFLLIEIPTEDHALVVYTPNVTPEQSGWQHLDCSIDVPEGAGTISLCLRLEGEGTAYGSGFRLETVDNSVAVSKTRIYSREQYGHPPYNLTFKYGLYSWHKESQTLAANADYALAFADNDGRNGGHAAVLKSIVDSPRGYNTLCQYASTLDYRGKRVRFAAYVKTDGAAKASLWMRLSNWKDDLPGLGSAYQKKPLPTTTDWVRVEEEVDIPATATDMSFGIALNGKGNVWVDEFRIEVIGDSNF